MSRRPAALLFFFALLFALAGCNEVDPVIPGNDPPPPGPAPYLEAEPPFSPGATNSLSWTLGEAGKTDGWEFLLQRAGDPEFAAEVVESGWVTGDSFTFTDLGHATTNHYRVRARDAQGTESDWSAVRVSTQDAVPPAATLTNLREEQNSLLFFFDLDAVEETSGIREIELWFRSNGGETTLYGTFPPGGIRFQATEGGPHELIPVAIDGSGNRQDLALAPASVTLVPEPIILVDRHGEGFDVTSAVLEYNMSLTWWEFGIGRFTIRPIIDPLMIGEGEVGYPIDSNLTEIVGVQFGDDVRAYKIGDIMNREAVDDVVDGMPIAVIYCPLCDSHGVFERVLDGEILTIAASGWTWHRIFVLQDYETGSLWFPGLSYPGQPDYLLCIAGPNQGKFMYAVPSHRTKWRPWKEVYPETLIMKTK